jgi:peptide/nickel transport system substrate-binding protein
MVLRQMRSGLVRSAQFASVLALVAGCSAPVAPPASAPTAAPAVKEQPTKPDPTSAAAAQPTTAAALAQPTTSRLVMSVAPPGRESNDVRFTGNTDLWALRPMYEFLIGIDQNTGKYIPQLATEWQLDEAGPSVRFKLRKGVQFHGGNGEFTAKDVVFTREQMRKDDTINGWRFFFDSAVKDIEVVNDYEVVFHLSRADPNLIDIISEAENGFEIRSAAHFEKIGPPTMESGPLAGTGAYQFKERAQAQYVRFERVPYQHWRAQPDFPEFEFRFQREASTRLAALQAGEVHITALPADLQKDAERRGFPVISSKAPGLRTFMRYYCCIMKDPKNPDAGWEYPDSPLMDVRVRKALNKAINRDELNKALFDGKGEPMYLTQHHQTRPGWDPSWETRWADEYGYDPAAARALLAEAGYTAGKPATTNIFVLPMASVGQAQDVQEAVAGYWRAVGVQVELLSTDPTEIANNTRVRKYSNHVQMWANASAMFTGFTGLFLTWGGRGNGFEDFDVDRFALEAVSTFDEKKQDEAWRKVGEVHYVKHAAVPLFWLPAEAVINSKVVSDYTFPGNVTGTWTHVYTAKAAR